MKATRKLRKRVFWLGAITFIIMNVIAFFHAYKFTHFTTNSVKKTKDAAQLSTSDKMKVLFLGANNPRPENAQKPLQQYQTIHLQSNKQLECWWIKTDTPKGTVVLFHGFSGQKASLLDKSDEFLKLGYNTFLVDFMGSGGSEGVQTTIGYKEAIEVKTCFDYIRQKGESNIYLFGTSMGAVAIMKAINDFHLSPKGIILECPFGSMYKTVCARFKIMKVPAFPMAGLLEFWGGLQNGFWAFGHNPVGYAKSISCPTLILYGEKDTKVSRDEIEDIFNNLKGAKTLKTYPLASHDDYFLQYEQEWMKDVQQFLR